MSSSGSAKDLLEKASLYIRRKIPQTGHLMCPKRLWLQTTPAESEVLIVFPIGAEIPFVDWILQEIKRQAPGLMVSVKHMSVPGASYGMYCSATYESLLQNAERLHLVKPILPTLGGGSKEFCFAEADDFLNVEDEGTFLSSQERQAIILDMLNNVRFSPGHPSPFPPVALRLHEGQPIIPKCLAKGLLQDVVPVHEEFILKSLRRRWVQAFLAPQPLDMICSYFGVKVAFYFAWLGYYTTALLLPGIAGLAYWCGFCNAGDQVSEDAGFVLLAVINVIWATVFLEAWKRKEKELAYTWGTLDQRDELLTDPRPMYNGPIVTSPVTGRPEPFFAPWKRGIIQYLFSFPLIFLCLTFVSGVMWSMLQVQDWWDEHLEKVHPYFLVASYIPKVVLALCVTLFEWLYKKIAVWLNDLENYRSEESYQDQLTIKLVLFQFVNSFAALFYVAFYLRDMEKLRELLFTMLIIRQIIGNIKESAVPYVIEQLRLAKLSFDLFGALSPTSEVSDSVGGTPSFGASDSDCQQQPPLHGPQKSQTSQVRNRFQGGASESKRSSFSVASRTVSQAEVESQMPKYEGTFEDYSELFIQFGYVAFFSSAFPLASLWAFFNNIIEIRTDAFKLCYVLQRPFGERVRSIGTWQDAMEWMGIIAIMVNCALIGQSGQMQRIFPNLPAHGTFILIVLLEHLMLILRAALRYCIPDKPTWVATEMAKIEFSRRNAARNTKFATAFGQGMNDKHLPRLGSYSCLRGFRSQSLDRSSPPTNYS